MVFLAKSTKPLAVSIATAVAAVAMAGSSSVYAQRQIEEVVVTAERRDATEQTTSISMEVFTGESLAEQQVTQILDLQNAMPSIQIQSNGVGNDINIRGVGNSQFSPQVQMGVQVVNDGLTHGEPMGLNGAFFDVGTVEVLRGPQGTFIGQSAAGGAILINSANPDFDGVHGYLDGGVGNYQLNTVEGAVNLPISDTWAARVAFRSETRNSFYENRGSRVFAHGEPQQNPGSLDNRQMRFNLLWQPNQQFDAVFKVEQNRVNHHGDVRKPKTKPTTGITVGDHDNNPSTPDQPYQVVTYAQYREYSPLEPFVLNRMWAGEDFQQNEQYSLRMNYELANGMTISSNTGYNRLFVKEDYVLWSDENGINGVPMFPDRFQLGPDNRSKTQEITLSSPEAPTNWIVGLFVQDRYSPVRFQNPADVPNTHCGWQHDGQHVPCGDLVVPTAWQHVLSPATVKNRAVFGQYNYAMTDELELAVGLRYNNDTSSRQTLVYMREQGVGDPAVCDELGLYGSVFNGINEYSDPSIWGCRQVANSVADTKVLGVDESVPTYKIGLNWEPGDNSYFYVFYAKGYKAGTSQGTGVAPEDIDDYEFGWKGSLFDGALTGDLGFYYMDYTDMQGSAFVANDPLGSDSFNTSIGNATLMGIEGSFTAFFGDLGVTGAFSIADSEIENIRTINTGLLPNWADRDLGDFDYLPQCGLIASLNDPATAANLGNCFDYSDYWIELSGQQQITAPDLSYNLSVDYQFQFPVGTLTPRLSYSYTAENYANVIQTDYYRNDERRLLSFSLNWLSGDWTVQGYINNLTDELYIAGARDQLVNYGAPRTYGVRARYNF